MPLLHLMIVLGTAVAGYSWYSGLTSESANLSARIGALQEEQKKLDVVIKQNQIYETRKVALEKRIQVIEDLKKNQLSPVVVLDALDEAIDRTRYVWLSTLSQNNATISMAGTGTSGRYAQRFCREPQVDGILPQHQPRTVRRRSR
jgi:Tfp pilus assembly protein PilN